MPTLTMTREDFTQALQSFAHILHTEYNERQGFTVTDMVQMTINDSMTGLSAPSCAEIELAVMLAQTEDEHRWNPVKIKDISFDLRMPMFKLRRVLCSQLSPTRSF